jgi:hypothetical protein
VITKEQRDFEGRTACAPSPLRGGGDQTGQRLRLGDVRKCPPVGMQPRAPDDPGTEEGWSAVAGDPHEPPKIR